jgi:hypothetical protein
MKTFSHRSAPQRTEIIQDFSVFCGTLRWLLLAGEMRNYSHSVASATGET